MWLFDYRSSVGRAAQPDSNTRIMQVCPPLLLVSPAAHHIWWALTNHPSLHSIRTFESLILQTASEKVHLQESDNASANDRLHHWHMRQKEESGMLMECIFCHSHQNALVETAAVTLTDSKLVSDFFSLTHFVQAGTHFTKLKQAVRQYVLKKADIRVVDEPVPPSQYAREICCMVRHARYTVPPSTSRAMDADADDMAVQQDQGLKSFAKAEAKFLRMWNGPLHESGGVPVHLCIRVGPNRCCVSDGEARRHMAEALLELALARQPDTPAPGKWTKLWSGLLFCVGGIAINSFLYHVLPLWLESLAVWLGFNRIFPPLYSPAPEAFQSPT